VTGWNERVVEVAGLKRGWMGFFSMLDDGEED
jgi:hypothetical protein